MKNEMYQLKSENDQIKKEAYKKVKGICKYNMINALTDQLQI